MRVYGMQVNHIARPLGFDLTPLRFSYKVACEGGKRQQSARMRVYGPDESVVYDSGTRQDIDSLCFAPDIPLSPRTRYTWDVTVTADTGETALSPRAWFETAKQQEPWLGQWIAAPREIANARLVKRFALPGRVVSARLYICGLGLYEAFINGQKAGDEYLAPGCNKYDSWLQYQTYDVTDLLAEDNEIAVLLGDGWYKGRFGFQGQKEIFGNTQALICELHAALDNGAEIIIPSDDTWRCGESPVLFSNIYDGETWDASKPLAAELPARLLPDMDTDLLRPRMSPPVRPMLTLRPAAVLHTPAGETVLDMGQEITGFVTFRTAAERGHTYTLRYGEILQDGCFYTDNLRTAKQTFTYICDGQEAWARPHFTFFGFRYIKLEGFGEEIDLHDFVGCVLYSDMEQTAFIRTASDKVNRLCENALWGQRGNFVDVPTDCPQRDERMGWTGDIAVFAPTAVFNFDMNRFLDKWLLDVQAEQLPTGGLPNTVPVQGYGFPATMPKMAVAWWGDACVLVPWAQYMAQGDAGVLRQMYPTMKKYVNACRFWCGFGFGKHRYLWEMPGTLGFGDWVAPDVPQMSQWQGRIKWTGTASLCNTSALLAKIADILGETQDAKHYRALSEKTADAYCSILTDGNGKLLEEFQTAYVLPIYLNMFPTQQIREKAAANLAALAKRNDWCIGTGFPGTPYILFALCDNGQVDAAYHMLLNTKCPSWLYEVKAGATTIWERWDGLDENGVCPIGDDGTDKMISYNHYASGAVGDFLYRRIAGIEPTEAGYKTFRVKPILGGGLTSAFAKVRTPYGDASVQWKTAENTFTVTVCVPVGTRCELTLPNGTSQILASGTHTATCSIS